MTINIKVEPATVEYLIRTLYAEGKRDGAKAEVREHNHQALVDGLRAELADAGKRLNAYNQAIAEQIEKIAELQQAVEKAQAAKRLTGYELYKKGYRVHYNPSIHVTQPGGWRLVSPKNEIVATVQNEQAIDIKFCLPYGSSHTELHYIVAVYEYFAQTWKGEL